MKKSKKMVKVKGFNPMTTDDLIFCRFAVIVLFLPYAAVYGFTRLFKIRKYENMTNPKVWFALFDKSAIRNYK